MKTVNIHAGSKNWIGAALSNLAHTPFLLEDEYIASVEAFHQGIKYEDALRRREIFQLWGVKAKSAGREANERASGLVYWGSGDCVRVIAWQSKGYYDLYFDALWAKLTQNETANAALLATDECSFSHAIPGGSVGESDFQLSHFCQSLYGIRDVLKGKAELAGTKEQCSTEAVERVAKRRP